MDVSKPGATPADANSKPVLVAPRPMVADPMVSTRPVTPPSPTKSLATAGKKIEPLSSGLKVEPDPAPVESAALPEELSASEATAKAVPQSPNPATAISPSSDKPPGTASDSKHAADAEQPSVSAQPDAETMDPTPEAKAEKDKQAALAEQAKETRQAELKALVESKKYYLKIDDSATSSIRTFALTVITVLLIGAIGLAVAVDAEVLDLGIELPFNLI